MNLFFSIYPNLFYYDNYEKKETEGGEFSNLKLLLLIVCPVVRMFET